MTDPEEDRLRRVENTLLLLPIELTAIKEGQLEIVEHLETINGSFGEFDNRLHSVETKWDYQEKQEEGITADRKQMYALAGIIITAIVAVEGVVFFLL